MLGRRICGGKYSGSEHFRDGNCSQFGGDRRREDYDKNLKVGTKAADTLHIKP